jgi:D-glycero-D-manno-heptose 1,7-bisphosphate phosphatase
MVKRGLFLDRDGVINKDYGYVHRPEEISFVEEIFDLCRHAHGLGYLILVVTNQSGIGRGYFSESDFHRLMMWMKNEFVNQGCPITEVYFCPYHPTAGIGDYRRHSSWRKPSPGMILKAAEDFNLHLPSCVLVGDSPRDIMAGQAAGVGCNLFYTHHPCDVVSTANVSCLSQVKSYL